MADVPDDEQQDDGGGRIDRRSVLKYGGSGAVAAGLAGCQTPQNPAPGSGLRSSGESGASDPQPDVDEDAEGLLAGQTVRIGILAPMNLPLGQSMWDGARLAAQQMNEDGGMLGATVEVKKGDTKAAPNDARAEYRRLVKRENCDLTMGVFLGAALNRVVQEMASAKKLHITTASAAPRIGEVIPNQYEKYKYHFRAGPLNLYDLADAMLEFVENKNEDFGWDTIGVITEQAGEFDPYHERLTEGLSDIVDVPYNERVAGVSNWSPFFNSVEDADCDLLLVGLALIGNSAVNQWANDNRDFEFGGIHVPAQSYRFWANTSGRAQHVWTMNAMTPQTSNTERTQPFVEAYREQFDRVPIYSGAITYDAVTLTRQTLAKTMKEEGIEGEVPEAEKMIPYMEEMTYTGSTIMEEFSFTGADAEYAHEPQWTSIEETGVPVFQQWQKDDEVTPDYGTMHSFYPEENKTADYTVPDWIGGGG